MKRHGLLCALAASTFVIWLSPLGAAPTAVATTASVAKPVAPTAKPLPSGSGNSPSDVDAVADLTKNLGTLGNEIDSFELRTKDLKRLLEKAKVDAKAFEAAGSKDPATRAKLDRTADALGNDLAKLKVELGKLDQRIAGIRPKVPKGSPNGKTLDGLHGRFADLVAFVNAMVGDKALPRMTYSLNKALEAAGVKDGGSNPTSAATSSLKSNLTGPSPSTTAAGSAKKPAE